jgi:hypothetical protein
MKLLYILFTLNFEKIHFVFFFKVIIFFLHLLKLFDIENCKIFYQIFKMSNQRIIKNRYVISDSSKPFGEGSFGKVYSALDKVNSNRQVKKFKEIFRS